jgi:hypothetical protein
MYIVKGRFMTMKLDNSTRKALNVLKITIIFSSFIYLILGLINGSIYAGQWGQVSKAGFVIVSLIAIIPSAIIVFEIDIDIKDDNSNDL